ncbi:hypothetical protein SLEP1_g34970 [Rubroshorea leprosula]|uniref:Uncharacterized protein n=1 Tax=Rubroshorea leprosula TaxID=152421 RepID=A0AAV5KM07_9ROSI|nr:hypothetical protein SLEP1_g34970 [Rubroshorea leprosula]
MDHSPVVLGRTVFFVPIPNTIHLSSLLLEISSRRNRGRLRWLTTAEGASAMVDSVCEVLYKTRRHACRPYTPNYPPVQQVLKGVWYRLFLLEVEEERS